MGFEPLVLTGLELIRYLYKINLEDIAHITIIIIDF